MLYKPCITLDLQFLDPKGFDTFRLDSNRNPFKGPAAFRPPPRPPDPPRVQQVIQAPPPKPKIEVIYRGNIIIMGISGALVEDILKGKQFFFRNGAAMYFYKVIDFNRDQLVLQKPDGSPMTLKLNVRTVIGEMER